MKDTKMCHSESETVNAFDTGQSSEDQSVDYEYSSELFSDACIQENKTSMHVKDGAAKPNGQHFRFVTSKTDCYVHSVALAFVLLLSVVNSTFTKIPTNEVVLKRESTRAIEMPCESDCQCDLRWFTIKCDSARETLFDGYILRPRAKSYCEVFPTDEPGKSHLNLTIKSDAAQTYICFEPGTLVTVSADLILLETELICSNSSTEDLINLTCSIEFRGNWAPSMEWNDGETVLSDRVNTITIPNQRVISTLVMPAQMSRRNYTCTAKLDVSGKPPKTTALNVPRYKESWTYMYSVSTKPEDEMAAKSAFNAGTMAAIGIASAVVVIVCLIRAMQRTGFKNRPKLLIRRAPIEAAPDGSGGNNSAAALVVPVPSLEKGGGLPA